MHLQGHLIADVPASQLLRCHPDASIRLENKVLSMFLIARFYLGCF